MCGMCQSKNQVHGPFGDKFWCSVHDFRSNISVIILFHNNFVHQKNVPLTSLSLILILLSFYKIVVGKYFDYSFVSIFKEVTWSIINNQIKKACCIEINNNPQWAIILPQNALIGIICNTWSTWLLQQFYWLLCRIFQFCAYKFYNKFKT